MANVVKDTFGPFGGNGGAQWDDGAYTSVRRVEIFYSSAIDSIQFEYEDTGSSKMLDKHGESPIRTVPTGEVVLHFPGEYLVSVRGHFGTVANEVVIRSLTFESNKETYGPFGVEEGEEFHLQSTPGGKIIGFYGTASAHLNSIGAYFAASPAGGQGGVPWNDGTHTSVRRVEIFYSSAIDSIQFEYEDTGSSNMFDKHGESPIRTTPTGEVVLEFPVEYLLSVRGHFGTVANEVVIRSLSFESNKKTYGPFGVEEGEEFNFQSTPGGKIIGFYGKAEAHLNSIGAYFGPLMVKDTFGPFGGKGGTQWDDGAYTSVRRVEIFYSSAIDSIQFEYEDTGSSKMLEKHGESPIRTKPTGEVVLEFPVEYLVSVHGHFGTVAKEVVIRSLTFESNKKTYGPFGVEEGEEFHLQSSGGKIIGFYGTASAHLNSIGAYFAAFPVGGQGGVRWNDGTHTSVRRVEIFYSSAIDSIQFEYEDTGSSNMLDKHGESPIRTKPTGEVVLDFPVEYLVSVRGHFGTVANEVLIRSLTFESNTKTYGPFGVEEGEEFNFQSTPGGKIIGFYGKAEAHLNSIGAYFGPLMISRD